MNKGLIFDIRRFSVHDGPGIRTTVFFKGCPLNCQWCHNPESSSPVPEKTNKKIVLDGITYSREEITGNYFSVKEVMETVLRDRVFYEESGGGVTFSGGEPLMQPDFLTEILNECRKEGIHTAVDTCGYAKRAVLEKIIPLTGLFLFDLKLLDDADHVKYTGVSNRIILDNFVYLARRDVPLTARFPVIPGITDTPGNIDSLVQFLQPVRDRVSILHLLSYHSSAKSKYARLGRDYQLGELKVPGKAELEKLRDLISEAGISVHIGG